jgi:hypothetical protein
VKLYLRTGLAVSSTRPSSDSTPCPNADSSRGSAPLTASRRIRPRARLVRPRCRPFDVCVAERDCACVLAPRTMVLAIAASDMKLFSPERRGATNAHSPSSELDLQSREK